LAPIWASLDLKFGPFRCAS